MYRWSFEGNAAEALSWRGAAQQELFRLEQRMVLEGRIQGTFQIELSATAYAYGYIAGAFKAIHVVASAAIAESGGGSFYFEFATSGYPVVPEGGAYRGSVVGVDIGLDQALELKVDAHIRSPRRGVDLSQASLVNRRFDSRLLDGRVDYADEAADGTFRRTVYTSQAASSPYTGIYANSVNQERPQLVTTDPGDAESFTRRSTGFEPGFGFGSDAEPIARATVPGADWPRATGVQEVSGRLFGIYIDALKVYAFPVDSIVAGVATKVQSADIVFPSWGFAPTAAANGQDYAAWKIAAPDLDWKLRHDATKAVCVLHEREVANWDTAYIADPATGLTFGNYQKANFTGITGAGGYFGDGALVDELYTYGRGIFEIEIRIKISSDSFTLTLAPNEVRTPRGSNRGTFFVDYAWMDVKDFGVKKGDMILLDIERWYQPSAAVAMPAPPLLMHEIVSVRSNHFKTNVTDTYDPIFYGGLVNPYFGGGLAYGTFIHYDFTPYGIPPNPPPWGPAAFCTGEAVTFFSLRKLRDGVETELVAINGDSILGISLKTLSLAVGLEYEERVSRNIPLAGDGSLTVPPNVFPGKTTRAAMKYQISHPGVAIYTQGVLRKVLAPDGAATTIASGLEALARKKPRVALTAGDSYMAANDVRDWSGFARLRDVQLGMQRIRCQPLGLDQGRIKVITGTLLFDFPERLSGLTLQVLSVEERNWWLAMCAHHSNMLLLLVSNPNFGWSLYTSEIIHRTKVANTTFFAHPNGSWAFYDANRIYNTYGIPAIEEPLTPENQRLPLGKCPAQFWDTDVAAETPICYIDDIPGNGLYPNTIYPHQALPLPYLQMARGVADKGCGPVSSYLLPIDIPYVIPIGIREYDEWDAGHIFLVHHFATIYTPTQYIRIPSIWIVNVFNLYDSLTPAIEAQGLRQTTFDHVHIEREKRFVDTSFSALYATAIKNGVTAVSALRQPTPTELAATFVYEIGSDRKSLLVTMTLPSGAVVTVGDPAYRNRMNVSTNLFDSIFGGAGVLLKYRIVRGDSMPPTFSTCLMLDL